MSHQQILIRLPQEVADRLKAVIPARQRNRFVAHLVERALLEQERALGAIADAVTAEENESPTLRADLDAWQRAGLADGQDEPA